MTAVMAPSGASSTAEGEGRRSKNRVMVSRMMVEPEVRLCIVWGRVVCEVGFSCWDFEVVSLG